MQFLFVGLMYFLNLFIFKNFILFNLLAFKCDIVVHFFKGGGGGFVRPSTHTGDLICDVLGP